jgi:hypothetical protein
VSTQTYVGEQIIEQVGYCLYTPTDGSAPSIATKTKSECIATANHSWNDAGAIGSSIQTISSSSGLNTATIQQYSGIVDGTAAEHTIKIDNNGHVSGYGLVSNGTAVKHYTDGTTPNDVDVTSDYPYESLVTAANAALPTNSNFSYVWVPEVTSHFAVNADIFSIGHPGTEYCALIADGSIDTSKNETECNASSLHTWVTPVETTSPFSVADGNVYMDTALIDTAEIATVVAQSITVDTLGVHDSFEAFRANIDTLTTGVLRDNNNRFIINMNSGFLTVADELGQVRVRLGNLKAYTGAELAILAGPGTGVTGDDVSAWTLIDTALILSDAVWVTTNSGFVPEGFVAPFPWINWPRIVELSDEALVAEAAAVYTTYRKDTAGKETFFSIADSVANILAQGATGGVIEKAGNLYVTDDYTAANKTTILALRTNSTGTTVFRGALV